MTPQPNPLPFYLHQVCAGVRSAVASMDRDGDGLIDISELDTFLFDKHCVRIHYSACHGSAYPHTLLQDSSSFGDCVVEINLCVQKLFMWLVDFEVFAQKRCVASPRPSRNDSVECCVYFEFLLNRIHFCS